MTKEPPTFEQAMQKLRKAEERNKKLLEDKPRKDFLKAAQGSGFSKKQAQFLWKELALHEHRHWDGRIG